MWIRCCAGVVGAAHEAAATAHPRSGGLLLLHFVGFDFTYDEWVPESSPRIHWGQVGGIPAFNAAAVAGAGCAGATSWGAASHGGAEVIAMAEPVGQQQAAFGQGQVVGVVPAAGVAQGQVMGVVVLTA